MIERSEVVVVSGEIPAQTIIQSEARLYSEGVLNKKPIGLLQFVEVDRSKWLELRGLGIDWMSA